MNPAQRQALTRALSGHVAAIAADLRAQMLVEGEVCERARRLHSDEKVGDDFEVWTDLLSRRAAVLWVLKTVYVRVLEDRGLLAPGRLLDREAQQLFETLAPNLGDTAFLSWVFRDLASPRGGLPELFAPQPAEVAVPADARSRALIDFWRATDADTGFQWSFAGEAFAGELMGDLYQELDPVVKDRYALCQTPDFVRDFMLGQTLEPAIRELGADTVRVLDPACGSGHFLLDALRRLVDATAAQHADWPRRRVVEHSLDRVVGIDLNDYACALARARVVMTAAELAGVNRLKEAAAFHPHVYWADGLEQLERDEDQHAIQLDLLNPGAAPPPRAVLTRPHVRAALRPLLQAKFHVVVGNPPYITERDPARKEYHREKNGKERRYLSAHREYSLAAPFIERSLQLADKAGWIGLIVGNNFMKREFGKPLIEKVLKNVDLELVVDTSQAFIPHHGTPTVMLFARNRKSVGEPVRAVMGKRGEPGTPDDPAKGKVWSSIVEGVGMVGFENEFVSVADVARETFGKHPWSLGGGGAAELRAKLDAASSMKLGDLIQDAGRIASFGTNDVYILSLAACGTLGVASHARRRYVYGEVVRDWSCASDLYAIFPYDNTGVLAPSSLGRCANMLWKHRTQLWLRQGKGFKTRRELGGEFYQYAMFYPQRQFALHKLIYADVATHNQFAMGRLEAVSGQTATGLFLADGAGEPEYLSVLALLNTSAVCFWNKQVFHSKGIRGEGGGTTAEPWEQFYALDATKLSLLPVPLHYGSLLPWARELDRLARTRAERSIESVLAHDTWQNAAELRANFDTRREADLADLGRMVALQEELDWECYRLYGLDPEAKGRPPAEVTGMLPTERPVELILAVRDRETRAGIACGDEANEIPTAWFERHRWEPMTDLPASTSPELRALVAARRARIEAVPELALIEQPTYKRRWYRPDFESDEQDALARWLADRVEHELQARGGKVVSIAQLTNALEGDARLHAVAELLSGRRDYRLADLVLDGVQTDAVPSHPLHLYKPAGLEKRAAWERTWDEQRKEDAGLPAKPEVPPKYVQGDFLRPEYFKLRGKLDVPKERFIAFTEVPGRGAGETLYGWAGWTPTERVKAILAMDEECEDQGIALADRIALLDSAWRLIPDVVRDDAATGARLRAELQAMVGQEGPSKVLLDEWNVRFPPRGRGRGRAPRPVPVVADDEDED